MAVDPFLLFCAYHLGLDLLGDVAVKRPANLHDVARRFRVDTADIERALVDNGMAPGRMLELDFDLAGAQLDIHASPPGVDLRSIAEMHWEAFLAAPERPRDWQAELADDAAENERTFRRR